MTTKREDLIAELTEEWQCANIGDPAYGYDLQGWVAENLGITWGEAHWEIYGARDDGAVL